MLLGSFDYSDFKKTIAALGTPSVVFYKVSPNDATKVGEATALVNGDAARGALEGNGNPPLITTFLSDFPSAVVTVDVINVTDYS